MPNARPVGRDTFATPEGRRIALVINDGAMGGSERQALLLGRELARRGAHATILSLAGTGPVLDTAQAWGLETGYTQLKYPLSNWYFPRNLPRAARLFRRHRPDVLLGYTSVPNLYAGWLWRCAGAKVFIWGQRNAGLDCPPRTVERVAMRGAASFVANAESGLIYLRQRLGKRPGQRVCLIPNAVEVFSTESIGRTKKAQSGARVVCVANARAAKDHATLLAAWVLIQEQWSDEASRPLLDLVGAFPENSAYAREVRCLVNHMPFRHTVRFCGAQMVDVNLLSAYDVGVLSSKSEGMSNAILEYMAAGLPVVATNLPGTRFALGEEAARWMMPVGDCQQMASALLQLLKSPTLRLSCGEKNRERARTAFTVGALADQMIAIMHGSAA